MDPPKKEPGVGPRPGAPFYLPSLDGLRFLAFFLVFLHHARWTPLGPVPLSSPWFLPVHVNEYGWIGVDLFLCLSSYLITKLLWLEWQRDNRLSLLSFYLRRVLRIWPLYFLACLLGFLIVPWFDLDGPACGTKDYFEMIHQYLWAYLGFFANVGIAAHGNIPSLTLSPLWTVSLEEQFYILWPLFLVFARFNKKRILKICLVLLIFTVLARFYFFWKGFAQPAIWVSLPTRLDPFIFGTLLAFFEGDLEKSLGKIHSGYFLGIGTFCLAWVMSMPNLGEQGLSVLWQPLALAIGWILIIFSANRPGLWRSLVACRPFVQWGKISYGLYVYHFIVLHLSGSLVRWLQGIFKVYASSWAVGWTITLLGFGFTLFLASLSYHVFETPFLELKKRFTFIPSRPV